MGFKKDNSVQFRRTKTVKFSFADFIANGSGLFLNMIDLPPKARVFQGGVTITTAFNSSSSDNATVGDSGTGNKFKTSFSIASTGYTALVPTGEIIDTTAKQLLGMVWTGAGNAPTAGAGILDIEYAVDGLADEYVN